MNQTQTIPEQSSQSVYVLFCGEDGELTQFIAVYDDPDLADTECQKRNDYEERNYGYRSSWVYSVKKHQLNSVIWKR